MSIHRTQIGQSHIFKQHTGDKQLLDAALRLANAADHPFSVYRYPLQGIHHSVFQLLIAVCGPDTV